MGLKSRQRGSGSDTTTRCTWRQAPRGAHGTAHRTWMTRTGFKRRAYSSWCEMRRKEVPVRSRIWLSCVAMPRAVALSSPIKGSSSTMTLFFCAMS